MKDLDGLHLSGAECLKGISRTAALQQAAQ
jgi:hypothetical protein